MIFLTGASGLLGSAVAQKLLQNNLRIRAHHRPNSALADLGPWVGKIEWVSGNLLDSAFLEQCLQDCQAVVHCAGLVSFKKEDRQALYQTNVSITEALVNSALHTSVEKFVHISSVAALGRPRNKAQVSEDQQWEESDLNSYYAKTKHWAELEVWRGIAEGLPAIILNPSIIVGAHPQGRSSSRLLQYVDKEPKYYPLGTINWVALSDVVDAIKISLAKPELIGNRYIISAGSTKYSHFFEVLSSLKGKRPPYVEAKVATMQLAYYLEQIFGLFGKKEKFLTKESLKLSKTNIEFNNSKSIAELGLSYKSLELTCKLAVKVQNSTFP